ncbi:MAG: hypothetical protein K8I30_13375 [Anaerolineae bacterium]|nr:hypothetical protein [Anaerolineae bacterium]
MSDELTYLSEQLPGWVEQMTAFGQRHPPGSLWNALLKRRSAAGWEYTVIFDDPKTRAAVQDLKDFCTFNDRLCLAYWDADDTWREWLRQTENPFRVMNTVAFVEKQTVAASATASIEPLRIALAAISIEDWTIVPSGTLMPSDEFDMSGILLNVITASREAGGITDHLLQMASLSSDKPSRAHPNSVSMRDMMIYNSQYR